MLQDGTSGTEWKHLVSTGRVVLWMWVGGVGVNLTASPSTPVIEKIMQEAE
jgi:hypothetical protein